MIEAKATTTPTRKEKHAVIGDSVRELNDVLNRLHSLRDRIDGGDGDVDVGCDDNAPCLSSVLDGTPPKIYGFIESAKEIIDDIEVRLF